MKTQLSILATFALAASTAPARDLRVGIDPEVPTIAHAIKLAEPGDTIHLEPGKVYYDYAGFYGKKGAPGRPITLEGHGAILEGTDPLDPAQWQEVSPGLYAADALLPRFDEAMLARWFFLWDGSVNRMGRASKGRAEPLKAPAELLPGEWTFVADPSRAEPGSRQLRGAFYLRLRPGEKLASADIRVPVRSAGVQMSGENAHLVIRNLTARHPYNDGFNIHGHCEDVLFENIAALGCGDDGISAHGTARYRVRGFASIGNSTGICDTVSSVTSYEDVFIADCVSVDLYFLDEGRYGLKNALVHSSAQQPFIVTGRAEGDCRLSMENVLIRRLVEPRTGRIAARARVEGSRCTFEGMDLQVVGEAIWRDTLVDGQHSEPGARGADRESLEALASVRTTLAAAPRSPESLPVFLLLGQSNMTGADSDVTDAIPGNAPEDAAVLFWNRSAYQGTTWEDDDTFGHLRPQSSAPYGGTVIGPEFGFARELLAAPGWDRLALLKVSFPSTSMAVEWRGDGFAYEALVEEAGQAMAALEIAGERAEIAGILVHQGISDALHTEAMAAAYGERLRTFVARVRADFAQARTPVVLARENLSPIADAALMETVRAAIVEVAETSDTVAWIDVDDLERVRGHHFTAAAQMEIGRRYARKLLRLLEERPDRG
jgi:hypothetical protein